MPSFYKLFAVLQVCSILGCNAHRGSSHSRFHKSTQVSTTGAAAATGDLDTSDVTVSTSTSNEASADSEDSETSTSLSAVASTSASDDFEDSGDSDESDESDDSDDSDDSDSASATATATASIETVATSAAAAATAVASAAASGSAVQAASGSIQTPAGFSPGAKFQITIQDPPNPAAGLQPADATVWDLDLFEASGDRTIIPALQAAGLTVICYFNAGAVQTTDCDYSAWTTDSALVNSKVLAGYSQEKYVDITDASVVDLHKKRIALAQEIGCDGVDPDNVDTYELSADETIGKQITQEDMITFLSELATYAHSLTTTRGNTLMIGQKNAYEIADRASSFLDFAILENCLGSGADDEVCSTFQKYYTDNGKPVFDIEYPSSLATDSGSTGCASSASSADLAAYCQLDTTYSTGISRILKLNNDEYGLNGCTQYCSESSAFFMASSVSASC